MLVPPENGYGKRGMNEIPVKTSYCYLVSFTIDANLTFDLNFGALTSVIFC